ncbi:MAG: hydantoinase/oxoprolinase family protein [Gammaproteobacteria bacterium]|nr:hydantoinase/oxoprolinase family protein [Gammaproteobacteria bacterium]
MTSTNTTPSNKDLWLGLDTGGTYTDAVILNGSKQVIATAKSLTTKHDLSIGLAGAIKAVIEKLPAPLSSADISLVSVSTTLATNAVVENQRGPICAILIGYDEQMLSRAGLREALINSPTALIAGGHRASGEELAPLDIEAATAVVLKHAARVDAFAVSSLFSVRNPSHEVRLRQLIRDLTHKPVTCGHELTSRLDAPRRALTTALNAQLTPQIRHLIEAVQAVLAIERIHASLMVVKGDGSLMDAKVALECPVETILSGPAASVVGAKFLTGIEDFVVSDMGGTTTDIAIVRDGKPVLNDEGALVGGWNTMVQAVDVRTYGLGGDSEVGFNDQAQLTIGPRRVVPLSLLAKTTPAILDVLRAQALAEIPPLHPARFAFRQSARTDVHLSSKIEQKVWDALAPGPQPLAEIARSASALRALRSLVSQGLVAASGITPSDAMHVLGEQHSWDVEAARLGAALLIRERRGWLEQLSDTDVPEFCTEIREAVVRQTGRVVFEAVLAHDPCIRRATSGSWGRFGDTFIEDVVSGKMFSRLANVTFSLNASLIAIGAPVRSYYPQVAERLQAPLVIPEHAAVTNAIGAVAGVVMQSVEILVTQPKLELFRVHGPEGPQDFPDADAAIARAAEIAQVLARDAALRAGAVMPKVDTVVQKKVAKQTSGKDFLAEATVRSTATGRPLAADVVN